MQGVVCRCTKVLLLFTTVTQLMHHSVLLYQVRVFQGRAISLELQDYLSFQCVHIQPERDAAGFFLSL